MEGGAAEYLNQAAAELKAAMQREKEGEFSAAIRSYRAAVDILITGVQGEQSRQGALIYVLNRVSSVQRT